jgi:hypothetical protein
MVVDNGDHLKDHLEVSFYSTIGFGTVLSPLAVQVWKLAGQPDPIQTLKDRSLAYPTPPSVPTIN